MLCFIFSDISLMMSHLQNRIDFFYCQVKFWRSHANFLLNTYFSLFLMF
jgi:hypothetical protein